MMVSRQMGNVSGDIIYLLRKIDGNCDKFDQVKLKVNLSDAIQQLKLICKDLNLDYTEVSDLGEKRYLERKREFIEVGKGDLFV
jgi:hypothetical protein